MYTACTSERMRELLENAPTDPRYDAASHYAEEHMICHSPVTSHHSSVVDVISSSADPVGPN